MSDYAVLGPVDPQLGEYPAASILKAAHQKPVAEVDDKTLILADQAEKAIAQCDMRWVSCWRVDIRAKRRKRLPNL